MKTPPPLHARLSALLVLVLSCSAAWAQTTSPIEACFNFLNAQDFRRAQTSGEALVKKNPNDWFAQMCLGKALNAQGNYKPALAAFKKVEALSQSKEYLSIAYGWLGEVYRSLGQIDEALNYGQRALLLNRELKNREGEAKQLNNLAILYKKKNDKTRAISYYEQSLALQDNDTTKVNTWANMAGLYFDEGNSAKAIALAQQALNTAYRSGNALVIAKIQFALSTYLIAQNDFSAGESLLADALAVFQKLGVKDYENDALDLLNFLSRVKNKPQKGE